MNQYLDNTWTVKPARPRWDFKLAVALAVVGFVAGGMAVAMMFGAEVTTTNLPATITSQIVTNIIEGNNQKGCSTCKGMSDHHWAIYHPAHGAEPWQDMTERWTISNLVRRVTMTIPWNGKVLTHREEIVLHSTTNRETLQSVWKKE